MHIEFDLILERIKAAGIEFTVHGMIQNVIKLSAIGDSVENSVCYYVGNDPNDLKGVKNSIIICLPDMHVEPMKENTFIFTKNPQLCFYIVSSLFEKIPTWKIHKSAIVDSDVYSERKVHIGPFCHIGNCYIGNEVIIESGVKIHSGSVIGDRVRIQSNTVIGANGVMWTWGQNGKKISCVQTGNVIIEDDVFIGSNITVVRGAFSNKNTIIRKGSTIAHGTMIGHGAVIGYNNHFANNVSIAGSVITGKNCFFGSGAVVRPHVKIADDTIVGAGAVVVSNFNHESGMVVAGNPAKVLRKKKHKYSGVPANSFL